MSSFTSSYAESNRCTLFVQGAWPGSGLIGTRRLSLSPKSRTVVCKRGEVLAEQDLIEQDLIEQDLVRADMFFGKNFPMRAALSRFVVRD